MLLTCFLPLLKKKSLGIFEKFATMFPREITSRETEEDSVSVGLEQAILLIFKDANQLILQNC